MRDVILVCHSELRRKARDPLWIAVELLQPLLYLFLFGPLMKQFVRHTPGFPPGGMWAVFTPAMMMQVAVASSSFVGMALLAEYRSGELARYRVLPIRRSSYLLGKMAATGVDTLVLSAVILLCCMAAFGVRPGVVAIGVTLMIVVLFSATMSACSYAFAMTLKDENVVPAVTNALIVPIMLLSGALVPITRQLAPPWLFDLSRLNPVSYVMDAARAAFRGDYKFQGAVEGVFVLLVLFVAAVVWSVRAFSGEEQ